MRTYAVDPYADQCFASSPTQRARSGLRRIAGVLLLGFAAGLASRSALADNFANVHYDARKDQLVVTMFYRGTNAGHTFSLQWGPCKDGQNGGAHEIEATVLDSQWQDAAQHNFKQTTRFSLADLNCRPATLTLRTPPRFYYTVQIPARHN